MVIQEEDWIISADAASLSGGVGFDFS